MKKFVKKGCFCEKRMFAADAGRRACSYDRVRNRENRFE